jgi:hypothetical protein
MNYYERRLIERAACERRYGIADEKGAEYSQAGELYRDGDTDTLHNFFSVAERAGMTPVQCLLVYLAKHLDSVYTTAREAEALVGDERKERYAKGEGIIGRMDDARNYFDLLECVLADTDAIDIPWDALMDRYDGNPSPGSGPDDTVTLTDVGTEFVQQMDNPHHYNSQVPNPEPLEWEKKSPAEMDAAHYDALDEQVLRDSGLVECLDGVWRPGAIKHESVKNPGEVQTPIYAQPAVFDPPKPGVPGGGGFDPLETGELA